MSDDKNPFSLEENTVIFARRVLDNVRVVAQEAVKQEQKRVLDMKREVRAELEERLPELVSKAALAYARGEHDAKAPIVVPFCHLEKEEDVAGKLSERDTYRCRLLEAIGYDPAVSDGKLELCLVPEDFMPEAKASVPELVSPRMTQQMYLPPSVVSGASVPRASPPPVMERVTAGVEEGDEAPLPEPPDTNPGTDAPSMPSPGE